VENERIEYLHLEKANVSEKVVVIYIVVRAENEIPGV